MKRSFAFVSLLLGAALLGAVVLGTVLLLNAYAAPTDAGPPAEDAGLPAKSLRVPKAPADVTPAILPDQDSISITVGQSTVPGITFLPEGTESAGGIWTSSDTAVAAVDRDGRILGVGEGICTVTVASAENSGVRAEIRVEVTPHADITYIDGILIANKTFSLPADYDPGVDEDANAALNEMVAAAQREGIALWVVSGFRSYNTQAAIYQSYVARDGMAAADRYSARAGHSEHQTGLAFDLNSLEQSFGDTPEGQWLAANCWRYGFIIRYPQEKEALTGYMYEPWHVRYLGRQTAKKVYESGLCLEEYLGITSVYAD